jgi:hypothetical protein
VNEDITWEIIFPTDFDNYGKLVQKDSRVAVIFEKTGPVGTFKLEATYHDNEFTRRFQKTICCPDCWDSNAYEGREFFPEPIVIEVEPTLIDCDGGYHCYYKEWNFCGCPNKPKFPRGCYWFNKNDNYFFLIGEPVLYPIQEYGSCPSEYVTVYEQE